MKKNYVKPQMQVVKINQSTFIMGSKSITGVSSNDTGITYGGGSSTSGRSRDYDDWDEE